MQMVKSAQRVDGESLNAKSRLHTYEARLAADMGLESFEQFVFLQNFILTFDENCSVQTTSDVSRQK